MSLKSVLLSQKALSAHRKGQTKEALRYYREAYENGLKDPRALLGFCTLLLREGSFQEARELLKKIEKLPGLTDEQKSQLFMDYAVCCYKMGEIDKGVSLLEAEHRHRKSGIIYQTLGYLYVEQGSEKAIPFNLEAVEYDDEDPIFLDNLAQAYYRVAGDKEAAKPWFEKAINLKPNQIDTLWFLSRYDVENGDIDAAIEKLEDLTDRRFSPLNHVTKEMVEQELARLKAER